MGFLLLLAVAFVLSIVAVLAVKRRRDDLSDGRLTLRAGGWSALVTTIAFMLSIGAMGGDGSAGLGQMVGLLVAPFFGATAFLIGAAGGAIGAWLAGRK